MLELCEVSVTVSSMIGDADRMSSSISKIFSHTKTFDDSLTASIFFAKLLASQTKVSEAIDNCLAILSNMDERFPENISMPQILHELSEIQSILEGTTIDEIKLLPLMVDKSKLKAMDFMSTLCTYSITSRPMLLPLVSCRMVQITMKYGYCDHSIVGFIMAGYGVFSFTDDTKQLGHQIGKLGECLIKDSPNKHALQSRLSPVLEGYLKLMHEPFQSCLERCHALAHSGMIVGDLESAMNCSRLFCVAGFYIGSNLNSLSETSVNVLQQMVRIFFFLFDISIAHNSSL